MVRATAYNLEVLHKKRLYSVKNEPFSLWTSLGLNQGPPDYESVALLWTSLGLNQGPPDYESVALTN